MRDGRVQEGKSYSIRGGILMNFTRLEYFMVVAKYLSFTKAAEILYMSQPSLSKQIALLEAELDSLLFIRSNRTLRLTAAGNYIYQEFNKLIPEIKVVFEKAKRMREDVAITLRIGCVETITLGDRVINTISGFLEVMRGVDLYFERCAFDALHTKLMDGAIDVAFTFSSQIENSKDIESVKLEQRNRYVIMSAKHRLAGRGNIRFEDLRDETFVLYDPEIAKIPYEGIFEECRKAGFFPKVRYAPNNNTILDYLEVSGCVTFMDKSITENRKGRLTYIFIPPGKELHLVCVWRKSNTNPALHEFIKHLQENKLNIDFHANNQP